MAYFSRQAGDEAPELITPPAKSQKAAAETPPKPEIVKPFSKLQLAAAKRNEAAQKDIKKKDKGKTETWHLVFRIKFAGLIHSQALKCGNMTGDESRTSLGKTWEDCEAERPQAF